MISKIKSLTPFFKKVKLSAKSFSVFNKLKDYLKSNVSNTANTFRNQVDPEAIKVIYDEQPKISKAKLGKLTKEEQQLVDQIPDNVISTIYI